MNLDPIRQGEICEQLLVDPKFQVFLDMIRDMLDTERDKFLTYENPTITIERENAILRESKGAMKALKRVISLPIDKVNSMNRHKTVGESPTPLNRT